MESEPCFNSPNSPAESSFSTEGFPEELSDLEPYESEIDSEEFQVLKTFTVPVFKLESPDNEVKDYNIIPSDSDADHLRPQRIRRRPRAFSPDSTDAESDPDYDPEEEEEEHPPRRKTVKKEITSDYESEEMESEKPPKKTSRRPSKNPVPQQRKKGSKQKISSW